MTLLLFFLYSSHFYPIPFMANFFKDSMAELEHVVWPTHLETKKFFQLVVYIITGMSLFVYLLTLIFSNGLLQIRDMIHAPAKADISGSPTVDPNAIKLDAKTTDGKSVTITPQAVATPAVPTKQ